MEVTVPETANCWPNAVPLRASANSRLIPTARRQCARLFTNECLPNRTFSMVNPPGSCMITPPNSARTFSSFGSSHRLQALHGDQLAIRQELDVAGFEGVPEPL